MKYSSTINFRRGSRIRSSACERSIASPLRLHAHFSAVLKRASWIVTSMFTVYLVGMSIATADELPAARPLRPIVAAEPALRSGAIAIIGKQHFGHNRWTRRVAWRPGTGQFATAGDDGFVRIWDASSHQELVRGQWSGRIPRVLQYTADGEQLLIVVDGSPCKVIRWDADSGEVLSHKELPDLRRPAFWGFVVGSPQLDRLAVAKGSVLQVHDLAADRIIFEFDMATVPSAHRSADGEVYAAVMDFSPDGKILYVAVDDGILPLLPDEQRELPRLQLGQLPAEPRIYFSPRDLVVSSDGRWLAACRNRWTMVFDLATGKRHHILTNDSGRHDLVQFSHNSQILAGGGHYGHVKLWDVASGKMLEGFPVKHDKLGDMAFSEHGELLVLARLNEAIRILEVATGDERTAGLTPIFRGSLGFSSDGATLATRGERRQLFFWNAQTGESGGQIKLPPNSVFHRELLSPDMKWLVAPSIESDSNHGDWCIYDLSILREARLSAVINTGELPERNSTDRNVINALEAVPASSFAIDRNSRTLIGCGTEWDGRVITKRIWDVRTGKLVDASAVPFREESLAHALTASKSRSFTRSALQFTADIAPLVGGSLALLKSGSSMLGRTPRQYILFDLGRMAAVEQLLPNFETPWTRSNILQVGGFRLGMSEDEREQLNEFKGPITNFVRDKQN